MVLAIIYEIVFETIKYLVQSYSKSDCKVTGLMIISIRIKISQCHYRGQCNLKKVMTTYIDYRMPFITSSAIK